MWVCGATGLLAILVAFAFIRRGCGDSGAPSGARSQDVMTAALAVPLPSARIMITGMPRLM